MRFNLLDQVTRVEPGREIEAIKQLKAEEDYLEDHFPLFPVMPGVLMLETMFQASMWLVRKSEEFAHSMVVLHETRNVKYADFVEPGQTLVVTSEIRKEDGLLTTVMARGTVNGSNAVSGRLILERFNLADRHPQHGTFDPFMRREMRQNFEQLCNASAVETVL